MLRILEHAQKNAGDSPEGRLANSKFSQADILAKSQLRRLRRQQRLTIEEGAKRMGLNRKQLEDLEATKDYGCQVKWAHIYEACRVYNVSPDVFLKPGPAAPRQRR